MRRDKEVPVRRRHVEREVPVSRQLADVGPVARVWVICNAIGPTASREQVMLACKKAGINANTASTQYQLWRYSRNQAHTARTLPPKVKREIQRTAEVEVRM